MDDFVKKFDHKSKKKFVTNKPKFDYIFDTKDFILCLVYDEIVDKRLFKNLNIKIVILQTKRISQFFYSKIVDNNKNV